MELSMITPSLRDGVASMGAGVASAITYLTNSKVLMNQEAGLVSYWLNDSSSVQQGALVNTTQDSLNSTDCGDRCQPGYEFYNMAQFITGLIIFPIVSFLGLMGNIFILIVLAQKSMTTSTNVYLSALAVSDGLKLINDLLYFLTVFLLRTDPPAGNKAFGYLYPYAHFIFNMSVCVSSWLTVSVAVER